MFLGLILQLLLVVCYANAYDIGLCKEYYNRGSERGDTTPISIPFDYLKNNAPRSNEIFRGNFLINPSNFGKNWISFKPIGTYAKGEEYQVTFDTDEVEIGLVDNVKFKDRVNIGESWVAVRIVIKFDGLVEVYVDDEKQSQPLVFQLPEIYKNKPLFIEFKGPDHKKSEIIVFYDCAYFDRRRSNDTTGFDDSRNSSRQPSRGPQKSLRDPNNNRQPPRSQFSDPNKFLIVPTGEVIPIGSNSQRGPDSITDTNGYDVTRCEQYNHQGNGQPGNKPISIPLNSLRNNKANGNDIFRGSFIVNPEKYGTVWISFKPVGEYAKGEEYQVVLYPELVSVGTIGTSKERINFPEKLKSWVSTEVVVRSDGLVEVFIDGVQEPLRYRIDEIAKDRPYFLELKGPNSATGEFTAFYDCEAFESREYQGRQSGRPANYRNPNDRRG